STHTSPPRSYTLSLHDALPILREVSSDISGDTNIRDVFAVVVAHALQMTGSTSASIVLASPDGFAVVATSTSQPLSEGISPDGLDRKSTRLNSSHRTISYAVFC